MPTVHKRTLVIGDIHIPYHNYVAVLIMLDFAQKLNIDSIILNGDFVDFHQLSSFLRDPRRRTFKQEIEAANQMLDVIQRAFPSAKIFYKLGNHDERYEKYLMSKAPELLGAPSFSYGVNFNLSVRGIECIDDQRLVYAGKLTILHGHEINMKNTTVNPARTLYLKAKKSALCSHLHLPSKHAAKRIDKDVISCWSTGHLGEEHPPYARNNEWVLGFAFVEYDKDNFEVSNYSIINHKVYRA
jgi:predicted phosphodiesterase